MTDTIDLDALVLLTGSHADRAEGVCLLEAAAWLAGKPHTDHPPCVSPVLGAFGRRLNDTLPDDARQQLKPYLPAMLNTAGDGKDQARGYLALDWLIRTCLVAWLNLAGLADQATALQELDPITDRDTAESAAPLVRAARERAAAYAAAAVAAYVDADAVDADAYADAAAAAVAADVADAAAAYVAYAAVAAYAGAAAADAADAAADADAAYAADADAAAYAVAAVAAYAAAVAAAVAADAAADAADAADAAARAKLAPTVALLQADVIRLFGVMANV